MKKIAAFSLLEVTIVIALTGMVFSIFFSALNRFNEQITLDVGLKNELNHWFAVRSVLWKDLDAADSLHVINGELHIFQSNKTIQYVVENELLVKKSGKAVSNTSIKINEIREIMDQGERCVELQVVWKARNLPIVFPLISNAENKINQYFKNKEWKKNVFTPLSN